MRGGNNAQYEVDDCDCKTLHQCTRTRTQPAGKSAQQVLSKTADEAADGKPALRRTKFFLSSSPILNKSQAVDPLGTEKGTLVEFGLGFVTGIQPTEADISGLDKYCAGRASQTTATNAQDSTRCRPARPADLKEGGQSLATRLISSRAISRSARRVYMMRQDMVPHQHV